MQDIFNYNRTSKSSGQVASSEFAVISMGGKQSLVQSVTVSYGQQIQPITQIGDVNIYLMAGRAQGSVNATKLVGGGGFLSGWAGRECGKITPMSVNMSGGRCGFTGKGSLSFDGGVLESVNITLSAEQLQISESATIKIASMSAT